MINRTYRFDLNRPRSRHGPKFCKYKKCLCKIMLTSNTYATFESLSLSLSLSLPPSLPLPLSISLSLGFLSPKFTTRKAPMQGGGLSL